MPEMPIKDLQFALMAFSVYSNRREIGFKVAAKTEIIFAQQAYFLLTMGIDQRYPDLLANPEWNKRVDVLKSWFEETYTIELLTGQPGYDDPTVIPII
jgi:hypothetical protein